MKTSIQHRSRSALLALGLSLLLPLAAQAAPSTVRDIVLDQLSPQAQAPTQGAAAVPAQAPNDAMAVSILVESADGTLTPRSTNQLFRTGERLRVKVLASRSGKISIYNTNPAGQTKPVWSGQVQVGQETISPRLVLTGLSGEDQLHVVLEPKQAPHGVLVWLGNWLNTVKSTASGMKSNRDIQLDAQSTPQATYLLSQIGQGLVSTVRVVHTNAR